MKTNVYSKLGLVMMIGLCIVLGLAQFVQYQRTSSQISHLIENNLKSMQEISHNNISAWKVREQESALNLFLSISHAVSKSIERGEMKKFTELLEKQKGVKGLLEFSLFNREGKVSHSSDQSFLKKPIPEDIRQKLTNDNSRIIRQTEEAIEIYDLQNVRSDCVRCHMDWKEGESGGVIFLRYSTHMLREAEQRNLSLAEQARQKAQDSLIALRANILKGSILATLIICAVLIFILYLIGKEILIKPLNQITFALKKSMSKIASASQETLESSQQLSIAATDQASSLEETSATIEEMSSMTSQNSDNAKSAQKLVQETVSAIREVEISMNKVNSFMDEIVQASTETFKIIKTIDDIAYQTNLLALNAAVEAARAGDAGTSFAVVADEVRNLAMQTGESAKNTTTLIQKMINKIKEGSTLVQSTNEAFLRVTKQSEQVGTIIQDIAHAGLEQARGIDQVNIATSRIDKVTQGNAASAEKNALTSRELNLQVEEMQRVVQTLIKLNGD